MIRLALILLLTALSASAQQSGAEPDDPRPEKRRRDPFWPIGYRPQSAVQIAPVTQQKPEVRPLSEAELAELVKREQERIRSMIAVNGMIKRGKSFYVFLNRDLLVTEGDVLEVDVDGVPYRLVIKSLSENNIQLEPYRQTRSKEPQ